MKPLKLTMTAFGPYKETEIIDFRELEQNNLFVISGNTGAGKTTIFDGISFALYGSASGTDRENNNMLRSDFADDNTHTSVEIEFELNGHIYRILRQLGHVKKGNKSKTGEKYEFYEKVDGKEIPSVDRQIVSEIDKKVEEIIGLTKDQFKQIVMLPQGEFRKLLTSETENKEEILRRIFKTESYKHINEILKQKKSSVEQNYKQAEQMMTHHVSSIGTVLPKRDDSVLFMLLSEEHYNTNQILTGLTEEEAFYEKQIIINQQNYEKAYNSHNKMQEEFHHAKALNDRFMDLTQKQSELEELNGKVPVVANYEKQLENAVKASNIEIYEKQALEWRNEVKEKVNQLKLAESVAKNMVELLLQAHKTFKEEEKNKQLREDVSKKLDRLQEFLPDVKDMDNRKQHIERLKNEGELAYKALEKVKIELEQKNKEVEEWNKQITYKDKAVGQLPDKQQKLSEMRTQAKVLGAYIKLNNQQQELVKDKEMKGAAYEKVHARYQELEKLWMNDQATRLAAQLHDGEACPVCGSLEHPEKASHNENTVTKEALDLLRKERDEIESKFKTVEADVKANMKQLLEKREELVNEALSTDNAEEIYDKLVTNGKVFADEVEKLNQTRVKLQSQKTAYEEARNLIKQLQAKKEELNNAFQEKKAAYEKYEAIYVDRISKIPEEIRELTILEKEINLTNSYKLKLEKAWEEAQSALGQAKEEKTKADSNLGHAEKQLEETKEKREVAEKRYIELRTEAGFELEETYHKAKMSQIEQQKIKDAIGRFKDKMTLLKQQVSELEVVLKGKEKIDLQTLEGTLGELKKAYELAFNKLKLSKDYYEDTVKLSESIRGTSKLVKQHGKKLATIADLYDILRGQNSQKISFERYLQIEYLERIIDAANGRLRELSNGQFYLIRSDRQEVRGKQSGLGLDVYDAYTGQTRDVKTLSGGEKFNASLCLALGMSDVIQSFQGNISIDTMFIDEGFGSLDEESLNKSIDALIEIQQSGRMIGVISHVQEIKNMFPAILEVKKTKEGFSRTQFVLK
ncbi:AAA family ATPase [Oceanobacillus bengalensis]|uniref:Nuclease SbcCD subunit C n=1 Tax=Oceanobacillus bengalensis TaxID=1435466 RepID=A0A494Z518_9BACI|nr:SMC family ATPase [Oceanobacillus bengalensis]RKQ17613.1 SMC family ATPase [Oceanobacillus bengalensis]